MNDIKETIQGLYALKTYLASKAIDEHGPARESLIGMQKVVDSAVNQLQEQEAITVDTKVIGTFNGDMEVYCCRDCRTILDPAFHYCPNCGQAVKWNDID